MKSTKQLARELGLLRERKLSKESAEKNKEKERCQEFSYLIVIDFESTCWERDKTRTQEIIEFPAVLLSTKTGQVESEFHYYVLPQEHPTLSAFCHKLTGITQEQVENGIPLSLCLRKFSQWLHKLFQEKNIRLIGDRGVEKGDQINLAAIVTWSDWDLGVCLHYELRRKQIAKAPCFNKWIDLRATYTKFYGRKPKGLNGALQDVGIEFEGREHSGLHDSRNTAMLAWRMIRDGCVLSITKSLVPASANGGPLTHAHQAKKEMPYVKSVSVKNGTERQGDATTSTSNGKAKSGNTSGTKLPHEKAVGLRMRNPNIPHSSPGENRLKTQFEMAQVKRPAVFTPEKTSVKCQRLSTPNKSAEKKSSVCLKGQSTKEEPAQKSSHTSSRTSSTRAISVRTPRNGEISPTSTGSVTSPQNGTTSSTSVGSVTTPQNGMTSSTRAGSFRTPQNGMTSSTSVGPVTTPQNCMTSSTSVGSVITAQSGMMSTSAGPFRTPQNVMTSSTSVGSVTTAQSGMMSSTSAGPFRTPQNVMTSSTTAGSLRTPHNGMTSSTSAGSVRTPQNCVSSASTGYLRIPQNGVTGSFRTPQNGVTPPNGTSSVSSGSFRTPQNGVTPTNRTSSVSSGSLRTPQNGVTPPNRTSSVSSGSFKTPQNGVTLPNRTSSVSSGSFRTPQNGVPQSSHARSFKTPQNPAVPSSSTSMKATPPLCKCGRRAKRRLVQNPGPNMGRWFFSCVKGTSPSTSGTKSIGCGFFQWEHAVTMLSARPVTPVGRQTYFSKVEGVGTARTFTPVLQAPAANKGHSRLGVSSVAVSTFNLR